MKRLILFLSFLMICHQSFAAGFDSKAKWIGTSQNRQFLYSPYLSVFQLECGFILEKGSAGFSLIYGANDERLLSADENIYNLNAVKGQSYIKITLRISGDTASLLLKRSGYSPEDDSTAVLSRIGIPAALINRANRYKAHLLRVSSCLGDSHFYIDGQDVGNFNFNPLGRGGDFIAFPVLAGVGISAEGKEKVRVCSFSVMNYRSPFGKIRDVSELCRSYEHRRIVMDPSINAMPRLRHGFILDKEIRSAVLKITARGIYDAYINGHRITDSYFNPGITQYNKTHEYQEFDVTSDMKAGENILGVQLAEGWWMGASTYQGENWNYFGDRLSVLCQLDVTYTDGSTKLVVSNPDTWKYSVETPVVYGSLFQGEVFDARKEQHNWTDSLADEEKWKPAVEISLKGHISHTGWGNGPAPDDYSDWHLVRQDGNGVDSVLTLCAKSVSEPRKGIFVYDMGQNMSGVPRVSFHGLLPGQKVKMRYAEVKYPDLPEYREHAGMIMLENIRAAMAQDIFISNGTDEVFSPRYTDHGYRYMEISGIDKPLPLRDVQGVVLSSADSITADYETSDSLVNRLWQNIVWSARGNLVSIPTDCPQRNERLGWAGDISVFSPTAVYLSDVRLLLRRYLCSMRDVQHKDGRFPDIAPLGGGFGGFLWGSAGITVPWEMYLQWNDVETLKEHYPAMRRYISYVRTHYIDPETKIMVQEHQWGDLGDWLGPVYEKDDKSLIWEAYLIHDLDIMADVASVLKDGPEAEYYRTWASRRRAFFCRTYLQPETGKTICSSFVKKRAGKLVDTQVSYVLPLAFNIVRGKLKEKLVENLLNVLGRENRMDDGKEAAPYSLLTGFIGTSWICPVLSACGHSDAAYKLLLQRGYPSWLYPVTQGATTIWERLNSYTKEAGFGGNNRMNSFNHYSFGAVGYWMISHSIGIQRDEHSPGFQHFRLAPEPDLTGHLSFARGFYRCVYGKISSSWKIVNGAVRYSFQIPKGTKATVKLPGRTPFELGAGKYNF